MSTSEADERANKKRRLQSRTSKAVRWPETQSQLQELAMCRHDFQSSEREGKKELVPFVGIELTTYRLQGDCSTTELKRHTEILLDDLQVTDFAFFFGHGRRSFRDELERFIRDLCELNGLPIV